MGSGKKNLKKMKHAFSLGGFKPEKDDKPKDPEAVKKLKEMWLKSKKKGKNENKSQDH